MKGDFILLVDNLNFLMGAKVFRSRSGAPGAAGAPGDAGALMLSKFSNGRAQNISFRLAELGGPFLVS